MVLFRPTPFFIYAGLKVINERLSTCLYSQRNLFLYLGHLPSTTYCYSDIAAIGGDIAYQYGKNSNLTGLGTLDAQSVLSAASFGQSAQEMWATISLVGLGYDSGHLYKVAPTNQCRWWYVSIFAATTLKLNWTYPPLDDDEAKWFPLKNNGVTKARSPSKRRIAGQYNSLVFLVSSVFFVNKARFLDYWIE